MLNKYICCDFFLGIIFYYKNIIHYFYIPNGLISQEKIMSGFVYLMKNGDLYKLGCTNNLKGEANKMKPGEIISSFKTNDPKSFEARLLRLYKKKTIPYTNYFRLS